jgi:zinc transporter
VITLRRHIAPQRDALAFLTVEEMKWLTQQQRWHLRESIDQIIRYVENLDMLRERATVLQDTLLNHLSEQLNRNMYLLSIVTTLFLPLSFMTGLLGINVGGIPGSNSPIAFVIVCALMLAGGFFEYWLFKRLRLL